jgi:hypothetical protein
MILSQDHMMCNSVSLTPAVERSVQEAFRLASLASFSPPIPAWKRNARVHRVAVENNNGGNGFSTEPAGGRQ